MLSGGRGPGSEDVDRSVYSANRRRSGSRLRAAAVVGALTGAAAVGVALANLYDPGDAGPVGIDPGPVIGLSAIGTGGGMLVLFSLLVYLFAHRGGA